MTTFGLKMTDEQLMERLKEGMTASIDELYKRHAKTLYVFIRRSSMVPNPEDIVHDVFMRVIEKAHRFNPQKAWTRARLAVC